MPRVTGPRSAWTEFRLLVCVSLLAGCSAQRAELPPTAPPAADAARPLQIPAGAAVYAIDAERSVVTLRVYRAGPLARLGHNHVVTSTVEAGYAWTTGDPAGSGFEVRLPVETLLVDDPAARVAAGADFPGELPDDARAGTRRNMLRPEVLDAERYSAIIVAAASLGDSWDSPVVTARVTLKGETRTVAVPLSIDRAANELVAQGGFRILQSDFGITPFSVGGGAIQVADNVDVAFEIRAVRR